MHILNRIQQLILNHNETGPIGVQHQTCSYAAIFYAPPSMVYIGEEEMAELDKYFYCKVYRCPEFKSIPELKLKLVEVKKENYLAVG